jgi:hypothetical protein
LAIRTVTIEIRIKTSEGKRPYVNPVWQTKGRLKPLYARINGKAEHHPEGTYVLRYGPKREFLGREIDRVIARKLAIEQELDDAIQAPRILRLPIQRGLTIAEACRRHLDKISKADLTTTTQTEALAPKTIAKFEHVFAAFQASCPKIDMREIGGDDIVRYLASSRAKIRVLKDRPDLTNHDYVRMREVTVFNNYCCLRRLFKKNGIDIAAMLEDEQIPRAQDREPEAYTEEEIIRILEKANEEEKFVMLFFYASGFRKGEVAHLYWTDIDLKTGICRVTAKPGMNGTAEAAQNISVVNFSQSGTGQATITSVLQKIQTVLPSNNACNTWLQGSGKNQGRSGSQQIQDMLGTNLFGHGIVYRGTTPYYENGAFSGSTNPDKTPVPGIPAGAAVFTVNDIGPFFNVSDNLGRPFKVGKRGYAGNTLRAQASILIHEVAHQITVLGFQPDNGIPKAGKSNDILVNQNCRQLIEGLN